MKIVWRQAEISNLRVNACFARRRIAAYLSESGQYCFQREQRWRRWPGARANAIPRRRSHCRSVLCLIRTEKSSRAVRPAYRSEFELLVARRSMGQKPTLQIAARYVLSANADVRWRFAWCATNHAATTLCWCHGPVVGAARAAWSRISP